MVKIRFETNRSYDMYDMYESCVQNRVLHYRLVSLIVFYYHWADAIVYKRFVPDCSICPGTRVCVWTWYFIDMDMFCKFDVDKVLIHSKHEPRFSIQVANVFICTEHNYSNNYYEILCFSNVKECTVQYKEVQCLNDAGIIIKSKFSYSRFVCLPSLLSISDCVTGS